MSQYSFPVLEEPDMIAFLNDIGFPFQQTWKKPTPGMVSEIYTNLVDIVVGVEKDRLNRPEYRVMEQHGIHQDVYNRGLPELGMLMIIFQLMEACCIFNFSLRDITNPTWARLRTILSGVINFVRFQHEYFNAFDSAVEKTQQMEEQRDIIRENVKHLKQQYEQHVGSPEVQLLHQLERQEEALKVELLAKRQQREGLEDEFRSQSSKLKLLSDQVHSLDDTIKGLKYELDLLKSKDVTGLLHDVENLRAKVEVQQRTTQVKQQDLSVLRAKHELNGKFARSLDALIVEFQDYLQTTQIHNETISKVALLQTQLSTTQAKSIQLNQRKNELTKQLHGLKIELNEVNQRHEELVKSKQVSIQNLIQEKHDLENSDRENCMKIDELELEMIQMTNEIQTMTHKHHAALNDAVKRVIVLNDAVDAFHGRVISALINPKEESLLNDDSQPQDDEDPGYHENYSNETGFGDVGVADDEFYDDDIEQQYQQPPQQFLTRRNNNFNINNDNDEQAMMYGDFDPKQHPLPGLGEDHNNNNNTTNNNNDTTRFDLGNY